MKKFKPLENKNLAAIVGGNGWGDVLLGLLGGFAKSPTVEQLNGGATKNFKAYNCGPYGTGGTPNSCNFIP
ncbi:MAG TPA: hypothetical protein K8V99_03600 [Megamonas funiformis]|uniref:ComC/BlpC family peptide pheromone/bacteriocin n=1 Tax=Enterococcus cecorum TaxID=44008 RepID=UPI00148D29D7|nr:ComC/BlpC family peptide pheromone/bacteriocin [Enterococcus cecorum]HJG03658.1 hypothetical protein [Megamonas funiformis]